MPYNFDMSQIDLGSGADIDGFLSSPSNEQGGTFTTSSIMQTVLPPGAAAPDFELNMIETQGTPGLDALFATQPQLVEASTSRKVVARLSDLKGFTRISTETLIHKSERDLWALKKEADGRFYVERLFDDNGEPLKG